MSGASAGSWWAKNTAAWAINPLAETESSDVDTFNQIEVGGLVNV